MEVAIYFFLVLYTVNHTFVYRYQRTTLGISRVLVNKGDSNLQAALTPTWIGILGWVSTGLLVVLTSAIFFQFGWVWAIAFLAYAFIGGAIIDVVSPIPSYKQCFNIIIKSLRNDFEKQNNEEKREALEYLLQQVRAVEERYEIQDKI